MVEEGLTAKGKVVKTIARNARGRGAPLCVKHIRQLSQAVNCHRKMVDAVGKVV